jgi:hypothetical protein
VGGGSGDGREQGGKRKRESDPEYHSQARLLVSPLSDLADICSSLFRPPIPFELALVLDETRCMARTTAYAATTGSARA